MIAANFPWLTSAIVLPLLAALVIPLLPPNARVVRRYALGASLAELALILYTFIEHFKVANPSYQLVETYAWIPQLNLSWAVAADGISMPLIVLTGFVNAIAIWAAWGVTKKPRLFFSLVLILLAAQIGVFAARGPADVLLDVGTRTDSGLHADRNLGGGQTAICCNKVHPLHCPGIGLHFGGCICNGLLRRCRDVRYGGHLSEELPFYLRITGLRQPAFGFWCKAAYLSPPHLAARCPR